MRRFVLVLALAFALAGTAPVVASAEPPTTHEIIYNRPSGFWTSNLPARGGAYRWRLLGIGGGVALLMAALIVHLIRRANAERSSPSTDSRLLR